MQGAREALFFLIVDRFVLNQERKDLRRNRKGEFGFHKKGKFVLNQERKDLRIDKIDVFLRYKLDANTCI